MKRLLCMGLLLGVLCGCAPVMQAETVATPLEAALRLEQSLEQGEDTLLLRSEEKLDGEALFQVTEAIWPYAFTMGLTTYGNGLTEISVQVSDKARQEQAVQLAKGYEEPETVAFINGVLGSFGRGELAQEAEPTAEAEAVSSETPGEVLAPSEEGCAEG